jgi:ATP-dependent RNA helicase RhlE
MSERSRIFLKENAYLTFDTLDLRPAVLRAVHDLGFREPTPVQAQAIPPALAGRDVLASAETGSGKSAAFGIPLVNALADKPRGTTRALILAPTRELAMQIAEHVGALAKHTNVRVAAIYGGVGFGAQTAAFKRGTEIIVATPGRLLDHIGQGNANLKTIEFLVLDEADRMLDMGFLPVVRRMLKMIPTARQTLLFSATIPAEIAALTREMLVDPVRIELQVKSAPAEGITQTVYSVNGTSKGDLLLELLKDNAIYSAIAFTRTKARANRLAALLEKNNVPAERIHGDRSQAQRTRALADFKRGKYRVLVATDIAARGIDILELGHVVNYDVPMVPEDYIHRIGRTARAKATGDAITFVSREEEGYFAQIERKLGKRMDRAKTPDLPLPSGPPEPPERTRRSSPIHHGNTPARPPREAPRHFAHGATVKPARKRVGRGG